MYDLSETPVSLWASLQHSVNVLSPKLKRRENKPCQGSVRGHNAVTEAAETTRGKRRGAMQIQSDSWGDQTCRAMLFRHSILCLKGSTWRNREFCRTCSLPAGEMRFYTPPSTWQRKCAACSVRLCGKDRGASREGAERASEAAPARPPGAKCMLEYFKTWTEYFRGNISCYGGERISLSWLNTQTRTYTMQVVTSPDNSFIVLLRLFVPCGECMSRLRMMTLTTDTLCPAGIFVKA